MRALISSTASLATVVVLVGTAGIAPLVAMAGDEVDYSAPYLVVEDGKLVTKYPGQEHEGVAAQPVSTSQSESAEAGRATDLRRWIAATAAIAAIAAIVAGLVWRTRRQAGG